MPGMLYKPSFDPGRFFFPRLLSPPTLHLILASQALSTTASPSSTYYDPIHKLLQVHRLSSTVNMRFPLFSIISTMALTMASSTTASPLPADTSTTTISLNGVALTVPLDTATSLHEAVAAAFGPLPAGSVLAKRQDVASPVSVPAPADAMATVGTLEICFEVLKVKVCYTTTTGK
ncbi:hypothetical protein BDW74DRAFT_183724 [Aspergillus multicolor]|uniref:uncharacterized protein n=1 Tax=Aspergillus multicolor TaxID=41759 RepID=UPI003CCCDEB2